MTHAGLLVVVGASGVGKTTYVSALEARGYADVRCYYFDTVAVPAEPDTEWQANTTAQWVRRLAQEGTAGTVSVLDAQTRPSFIRNALREFPALPARVVLLECSPELRRERLIARGQPELAGEKMNLWAAYLRGQADAFGCPVIDTSQLSVDEGASVLEEHVEALRHHTRDLTRV
ncbi:MAG: hypothetical protein RL701_5730 [Pseudomonadota bacterium]|jgi:broad-specificity NMP kinase